MGRCTVRALALLLPAAFLVGCATEPVVDATAFRVPAMALDTNPDHVGTHEHPHGPDLHAGGGFGARLGLGERDSSLGVLYLRTRHEEGPTDANVTTHGVYVEYRAGVSWPEEPPYLYASLGIGAGGVVFDFDRHFHDTGGASGLARGEVGVALARFLRVHVGGGGFVWGYPGATYGTGAFIDVGLTLAF